MCSGQRQLIKRLKCLGTRLLQDNLSDLKAQIAANHKGIQLVSELIDQYGLDVVQVTKSSDHASPFSNKKWFFSIFDADLNLYPMQPSF